MIIARSPLRISLGGGGTDIKSFYREYGGMVIAGAIDKYVYVTVNRPFSKGIYLKYSEIEKKNTPDEISHPIIREAMKLMNLSQYQIEITTLADIPAGTGLGSSGSFTTALIKALHAYYRRSINLVDLAELACHIEIELLGEPIGKQDQYAAVFAGITEYEFLPDGKVISTPLKLSSGTINELEDNLLLFFTGISRSAGSILQDQVKRTIRNDKAMKENLIFTKELGLRSKKALEDGNLLEFGDIMNEHWNFKRRRSEGMTTSFIDDAYNLALKSGAVGGKLVGAGGGGFLLLYATDLEKLRQTMTAKGMEEVRFRFDFEGTRVILS